MAEIVEDGAFLGHEVDDSKEGIADFVKTSKIIRKRRKLQ